MILVGQAGQLSKHATEAGVNRWQFNGGCQATAGVLFILVPTQYAISVLMAAESRGETIPPKTAFPL
jgi:hypothetical protein